MNRKTGSAGVAIANVRESWGKRPPQWVLIMAEQCDRTSQQKVAEALGYSGTVVNQVLKSRYTGDLISIEKAVQGAFLNAKVSCPVLGELPLNRCLQHQRAKFMATNSQRVRLYVACHGSCKHSKVGGGA